MSFNLKVFSPSYNSGVFSVNCINSVLGQSLQPAEHFYIDDKSDEESIGILKKIESQIDENIANTLKLKFNSTRKYKLLNMYEYVSACDDEDVICVLDGDDWLADRDALKKVYHEYENNNAKYVYTNWVYSHNGQLGISKEIPNNNWNPYKGQWLTSAMSTFKASEFKKIPIENFLRWDKKWFTMGCDQAYVLPILHNIKKETGSYDSVRFIDEPLYVYQFAENPLKPRGADDGGMRIDAHNSVTFIKERGYVE